MIKKSLVLLIVSVLLCGCTAKSSLEEVTFSSWGSISEVEIIKKVIRDFEEENPSVKIKFLHIPQNYFQKIQLLFASNTAPDVIFINNLYLPVYESRLEDLSEIIDKEKFYPQALKGMSYNGRTLGVPRDISNQIFYVNTDMMSLPAKEWTIEDLLKYAQKATSKDVFGISYEDTIYWALPYLRYFGGGVLDMDGNVIINTPGSIEGIDFYRALKNKYKVAPSDSQVGSSTLAQMFLDKKLAMYFSGRWLYPKISEKADFNWAVINFPIGKTPLPCDVSGWAISKNSKHKESAIKFVKYLSDEKTAKYFAETGLIVPANIEASKLLNKDEHNEKVFLEVINYSENTPVNKNYKKLTDEINDTLRL